MLENASCVIKKKKILPKTLISFTLFCNTFLYYYFPFIGLTTSYCEV